LARIIKKPEVRRNDILDAAQHLVYTRGYERMTIQDILDRLHISKGAFYHYFDSKQALLEALIQRSGEAGVQLILPVLTDPELNALQKLQNYFDSAMRWKTAQKSMLIALLAGWYSDDNAILRQKELAAGRQIFVPLLKDVLNQGISEGLFAVAHPEQTADVLVTLILGLSDALAGLILSQRSVAGEWKVVDQAEAAVVAYTTAIERVLGMAPGSLHLIDMEVMKEWFIQ